LSTYNKFDEATLATMGWEIMNHPPYSPELAPSYFHLFGPIKVHLGGQKFQNDDGLKHSVLNLQGSQDETFHAVGIRNLPGQ
jgi:histone-lysine N-methyltransferase SETMAR